MYRYIITYFLAANISLQASLMPNIGSDESATRAGSGSGLNFN